MMCRATGRATTVVSIATPTGYKTMGQRAYQGNLVKVNERKIRHRRVTNDHLVSDPAMPVNLADPDVAALVQRLINMANDLARARLRRDENHLGAHPSRPERRMLMPGRSRSSVPILFRRAGACRTLFALA